VVTGNYYRQLAQRLLESAAAADDPMIAERLRARAEEYRLLAETIEQDAMPSPLTPPLDPAPQQPQQQQQQQQQQQRPANADEDGKD